MKRFKAAAALGLLLAIFLTSSFSGFAAVCAQLRADTLRLHILANSDSAVDQALKLRVRDAVLAEAGELFAPARSKAEAERGAQRNLKRIRAAAQRVLRDAGAPYGARVRLVNMYFATTRYPDQHLTLPAGRYDAVRVELGAARGKNWFCVLFPPLCLPAAAGEESGSAYTDAEKQVTSGGWEVRFAVVEWLQQARESLSPKSPRAAGNQSGRQDQSAPVPPADSAPAAPAKSRAAPGRAQKSG